MAAASPALVAARMDKARALLHHPADHPVARDAVRRYAVVRAEQVLGQLMAGVDPLRPDEFTRLLDQIPHDAHTGGLAVSA